MEAPERESSPRCPANMTETTCRLHAAGRRGEDAAAGGASATHFRDRGGLARSESRYELTCEWR
jgi:hypothetical protein